MHSDIIARQIEDKFYVEMDPPWDEGMKVSTNHGLYHMTNMVAMLIYGKTL